MLQISTWNSLEGLTPYSTLDMHEQDLCLQKLWNGLAPLNLSELKGSKFIVSML